MLKKVFLLLAIFWTLLSVYLFLSSSSSLAIKTNIKNADKYFHAGFHFVFVLFWYLGIRSRKVQNRIKFCLLPVVATSIFYGITIEIAQFVFTESRSADFFDILANCSGALIAYVLMLAYEKWGRKSVI